MRHIKSLAVAALLSLTATAVQAQDWANSGVYNGYGAMNQNAASSFSLRDPQNNLTMVNGQITSGNIGANQGNQQASSGVGTGGAGAAYGQAMAIGNQLQVQVIGFNNTVIVESNQTNTGNQTAVVDLNNR